MEIRKAGTEEEVKALVAEVSAAKYDGNVVVRSIETRGKRVKYVCLTLRVETVKKPGHRYAESGRKRQVDACWHVYRDVLTELFGRWPLAQVKTARATYRGHDDFHAKFPGTYSDNENGYGAFASGWTQVVPYGRLCPCEGTTLEQLRSIRSLRSIQDRQEAVLAMINPEVIDYEDALYHDAEEVTYAKQVAAKTDAECDTWEAFLADLKGRNAHLRKGMAPA